MTLVLNGTTGVSAVDGSASTPALQGNDANTGVFFPAADTVSVSTSGTERLRVDSSGNVGIGTSAPFANTVTFSNTKNLVGGDGTFFGGGVYYDTAWKNTTNAQGGWAIRNSGGVLTIYTGPNAGASGTAFTDFGERLRISSAGKFGIGNTNPDYKLDVLETGGLATVRITGGSSSTPISASGALSVGSTSTGDSRPLFIAATSASNTANGLIFIDSAATQSTAWSFVQCYSSTSTSQRAFIRGDGTFGSATSTYGGTSDARIKTDIVDASPKLNDLMSVRIVNYVRTDDAEAKKEIGVIAQELEQVFPGLVYETEVRDAEGNVLCADRKNVKYSVFIPMLIKAIQEQQSIIEDLKARITALEAK